ncbi:MAG TPA: ATPase [Sphingomicrobium sp.]|nr:ATPase [Sphingomicrobium sp.]
MKWVVAAGLVLASGAAQAEVVSSGPNGFHVRQSVQMVVPQQAAYSAFGQVGSWWNPEHSYSGKSSNLAMALTAGGCFCERLDNGGGIEHMRVSFVDPGKRIVLTGSLGPLLYEATNGVMDMKFERIAGGSKVTMDYKVSGFAEGGAEKLAPLVDTVLADQFKRYREYARKPGAKG